VSSKNKNVNKTLLSKLADIYRHSEGLLVKTPFVPTKTWSW